MLPLFDYEIIAFEMYEVWCTLPNAPSLRVYSIDLMMRAISNPQRRWKWRPKRTEVDRLLFGLISHHSRAALCLQCRIFFFSIVFSAHFTC